MPKVVSWVRSGPGTAFPKTKKLYAGMTQLRIKGESGDWYRVKADGVSG